MAEAASPAARRGRGLWIALALSLTLNLFFIGGLAWSMMKAPPRPPTPVEHLISAGRSLDLNDDQRTALRAFGVQARELSLGLRAANAPLMRQMWEEMAKPAADQGSISHFADQALDNRRDYQRKMTANLMTFLATLSPDQRKRFAEIASRRPGAPPPPRPDR
jgi:uncharacterized membrane protein